VHGFHDDEPNVGPRVDGRNEQVYVFEHAAAWFVEHMVPKPLIGVNPATLFPNCVTGWWLDASDNDIANFTFGVTADDLNRSVDEW
jgi:hypothetical protein